MGFGTVPFKTARWQVPQAALPPHAPGTSKPRVQDVRKVLIRSTVTLLWSDWRFYDWRRFFWG
ncbi:MAG: hypothetical protein R3B47_19035 [Bacteroidia bacterium]